MWGNSGLNKLNKIKKRKIASKCIGLVDADLLDNGTRHPNLVLLKLAGYFRDHGIPYELIIDAEANLECYRRVYLSRVFAFTKLPKFVVDFQMIDSNKITRFNLILLL